MTTQPFDYDWTIVGSGFGGSVSALRLAQKGLQGWCAGVLVCGRRFRDEDFAKTTWDLGRFLWAPALGLHGIFRMTPFKDVFIASGAGVGGGSIVYANTLYRAGGAADGADGYVVTTECPGAWFFKDRQTLTARGVVFAAGALGTNHLLANCKARGSLPALSDRLGSLVRTNSESILVVTLPADTKLDPSHDIAISSRIYPKPDTHIKFVTYGPKGDFMSLLFTLLVGDGTRLTRPLKLLGNILRHPLKFASTLLPFGWGRRSVMFLVMQSLDNAIAFRAKRRWFGSGVALTTEQDPEKPNPTYIDAGNKAAEWLAKHTGVVDKHNRVFGYRNLLVCDGAAMPANPGVNPSFTITAIAENAMSHVPPAAATA